MSGDGILQSRKLYSNLDRPIGQDFLRNPLHTNVRMESRKTIHQPRKVGSSKLYTISSVSRVEPKFTFPRLDCSGYRLGGIGIGELVYLYYFPAVESEGVCPNVHLIILPQNLSVANMIARHYYPLRDARVVHKPEGMLTPQYGGCW